MVNPTRHGRAAAHARRTALLVVLPAVALGGCGLIVGTPVGEYVFSSAAGDDAGDGPSLGSDVSVADSSADVDASSEGDAPFVGDSPFASDAIAEGGSAADAADGGGGCPGSQGPPSVLVTSAQGSYCIDSTEVTNAQYGIFLKAGFQLPATNVPLFCEPEAGSMDYTPSVWPAQPGTQSFPVIQVTWCQAYAYCAWAGKRLCGQIGGGSLAESNATNPTASQWFNACSAGGSLTYPYGNTFDAATCGGMVAGSQIANVKSPAACVGGLPGLYSMSGNVWEWIDACTNTNSCYAMGGAFDGTSTDLACSGIRPWQETAPATNIGFRCCADL